MWHGVWVTIFDPDSAKTTSPAQEWPIDMVPSLRSQGGAKRRKARAHAVPAACCLHCSLREIAPLNFIRVAFRLLDTTLHLPSLYSTHSALAAKAPRLIHLQQQQHCSSNPTQ